MKTTVIFHAADFDGLFCREIARKFLPDAELIGWDFGDEPLQVPDGQIYILDLPVDRPFGAQFTNIGEGLPLCVWPPKGESKEAQEAAVDSCIKFDKALPNIVWIDHHRSSIESHSSEFHGYRIDGVAACRLAWQWFTHGEDKPKTAYQVVLPQKHDFVNRTVSEPIAVRLAGEYDIWDNRDSKAELFQHGLRSQCLDGMWPLLLSQGEMGNQATVHLLNAGTGIAYARNQEYRDVITQQGFDVQFEGHTYLACNSHELDIRSQLFEAGIKPHHDGLLGFTYNGKDWRVSLYGIPGKDIDHSKIAVKFGGGGHRAACGMRVKTLPFVLP